MTTWHVSPDALTSYASGGLDGAVAASVEAHLVTCLTCQRAVAGAAPALTPRLERSWSAVTDILDRPPVSRLEAVLHRIGVGDADARLIATTPALLSSWVLATAAALVFALVPSDAGGRAAFLFLLVAPLLPLVGVAGAFSPRLDPFGELAVAAPMSRLHLVLVRGAAALSPALLALAIGAAALPSIPANPAAWLLPAVMLCTCSLAAATWVEPVRAAGGLAVAWASVVTLVAALQNSAVASPTVDVFLGSPAQLILAAITALALAVLVSRHQQFDFGRTS